MTKAKTQQIETHACSEPTLAVAADFTALHIAALCWELFSMEAPTDFSNEFTIVEGGDFPEYNVHDKMDMANHYFDMAFSIGNAVLNNPEYSVQSAYEDAIGISADTVVREEVMSDVIFAIENCSVDDELIQEDYQIINDNAAEKQQSQIAKLEKQLAELNAS